MGCSIDASLEVGAGWGPAHACGADMAAAGPAGTLDQPARSVSQKVPCHFGMGDRVPRAEGGEGERILQGPDRAGRGPQQPVAPAQFLHQVRGGLEAAAENQSDRWLVRLGG